MPQSLSSVYVHAVFSTKNRRPFLRDINLRHKLHSYLGAISKNLDSPPIRIGGVEDHVYFLFRLSRTSTQAEWVKEIKRNSTAWIKTQAQPAVSEEGPAAPLSEFAWQGGYACFSVSASNLESATRYIDFQIEHHRKFSFQGPGAPY
jgi:putative transposase